MIIDQVMQLMEDLEPKDLRIIKNYAEGLINKKRGYSTGLPLEGNVYEIGDETNGVYKVRVIKNRRSKSLVKIVEKISSGTRRKSEDWDTDSEIVVPFQFFKLN